MTKMTKKPEATAVVDDEPIEGQAFVLLSYVAPDARQKHAEGLMSIKFRGAFGTIEAARAHAKELQTADPLYDVYIAEAGKWLPFPPNPDLIPTQEFAEDFLNSLHQSYQENQQQKKAVFGERKNRVMRDGLDRHLLPEERLPRPPQQEPLPEHRATREGSSTDPGSSSTQTV